MIKTETMLMNAIRKLRSIIKYDYALYILLKYLCVVATKPVEYMVGDSMVCDLV